jgi:hypothetical protein
MLLQKVATEGLEFDYRLYPPYIEPKVERIENSPSAAAADIKHRHRLIARQKILIEPSAVPGWIDR